MAKRKKLNLGRYAAPAFSDHASLADIVDDATIIAISAVRMATKNIMIVRAMRDRVDFDDKWYLAAIRSEFEALAAEKDHDARRVEATIADAKTKKGKGQHATDYRSADVVPLSRRVLTLEALAAKLRTLATDTDTAMTLLTSARVDALDEIASSIRSPYAPSLHPLDPEKRAAALEKLAADLEQLQR